MTDQPPTPDAPDPTVRYEPVTTTTTAAPPEPVAPAAPAPAPAPAPTWQRTGGDSGRTGSIVFGVILAAIGLWFFADQTLGLELPRLEWSELWPVFVIGLGAWIVLRSLGRRAR
jgi:hypothetical protein